MDWHPLDVFFFISGLLIVAYVYGKLMYKHFEGKGVKYVEPPYPYLGSMIRVMTGKQHMRDLVYECYNKYPDEKYIGMFEVRKPFVMIRDLELIKKIGTKDFDSFHDHRVFVTEDMDLFGRTLFALQGKKWRDMRATLSPAFSALKMKNMFVYIEECAQRTAEHYAERIRKSGNEIIDVEMKDVFSKYTNDTIASSAFGLKVNTIEDESNEFYKVGKLSINFTDGQMLKTVAFMVLPAFITRRLGITLSRPEVTSFFKRIVHSAMSEREKYNIVRHDMIHLLMEAKKGSLTHENFNGAEVGFSTVEESEIGKKKVKAEWCDDDYTAQALIFFIGGFDTTSSLLTFFFYEMARNPDIQLRIQDEIDEFKKDNNKLTYTDIPKFKYLDMVVSETLRVWPQAPAVDRLCSKPYTLPPPSKDSNQTYTVRPNEIIWIPIYGIHHDPQNYSDPFKFDPERFSEENKSSINPTAYLPFGIGPRNCIGSRYALIVAKAIMIHMLDKFDVVATNKTEIPLRLKKTPFSLSSENGVWVGLKLRQKN